MLNNLKVRVTTEQESKEAQELFFQLGYEWKYRNIGKNYHEDSSIGFLYADNECITTGEKVTGENYFKNCTESHKEITLAELRAMVHQEQDEPFLTPECTLNDQYAEIEQIRQHSHYKKDVSNLEFIDVYRVLKLFDVTDPCLQHAIKKLLCSGQRGAKSSDQDVQEAIDSLVRFQQMRIEDTLD